jgi:hypothetical protein
MGECTGQCLQHTTLEYVQLLPCLDHTLGGNVILSTMCLNVGR